MGQTGILVVERQERLTNTAGPGVTWTLFHTTAPFDWPARELGFPTIAGPDVQGRPDTATRPPDEPSGFERTLTVVGWLGAGWVLVNVLRELKELRR